MNFTDKNTKKNTKIYWVHPLLGITKSFIDKQLVLLTMRAALRKCMYQSWLHRISIRVVQMKPIQQNQEQNLSSKS